MLPPRPGRTGAATAREAGPLLPAAAADLAAATAAFDEVWFGGRAATRRRRRAAPGPRPTPCRGARIDGAADARDRGRASRCRDDRRRATRPRRTGALVASGVAAAAARGWRSPSSSRSARLLVAALTGAPEHAARPGSASRRQPGAGPGAAPATASTSARPPSRHGRAGRRPDATVVVTAPDDYSDAQLRRLRGRRTGSCSCARRPGALHAVAARRSTPTPTDDADTDPGCAGPAPRRRRGRPARRRRAPTPARGDPLLRRAWCSSPRLVVLGSADVLRNDALGRRRRRRAGRQRAQRRPARSPPWPGCCPAPTPRASGPAVGLGDLFPGRRYRAFWWLVGVGRAGRAVARRVGSARSSASRCRWSCARPRWSRATAGSTGGPARATAPPRRCARGPCAGCGAGSRCPRRPPPTQVGRGRRPARSAGRRPTCAGCSAGPAPADDAALRAWPGELDDLESAAGRRTIDPTGATRGRRRPRRRCCGCGPRWARRWSARTPPSPAC